MINKLFKLIVLTLCYSFTGQITSQTIVANIEDINTNLNSEENDNSP